MQNGLPSFIENRRSKKTLESKVQATFGGFDATEYILLLLYASSLSKSLKKQLWMYST